MGIAASIKKLNAKKVKTKPAKVKQVVKKVEEKVEEKKDETPEEKKSVLEKLLGKKKED